MTQTVRDFILQEYAKLVQGGEESGQLQGIFEAIKNTSEQCLQILSEDLEMKESRCAYCLSQEDLSEAPVVPGRECATSEFYNTVKVCRACKASKLNQNLLEWWGYERFNELHPALRRKYMRQLYLCLSCRNLLDKKLDPNKKISLTELSQIFTQPCLSRPAGGD